jgi:hypothetical protein
MKRKMLALALLLGITALASAVPPAEASLYDCGGLFCQGKYSNTVCYCSASSERPGWSATCGSWKVACYR